MKYIVLTLVLLGLSGCSQSLEKMAQDGDWYEIGYQDGVRGRTERSFKELDKLGNADVSSYSKGYGEGMTEYCNPNAAYQIGLSGQQYEGICEGTPDAQRFRMEWERGWTEYEQGY
ncbi:DUF2799 domain-containing protein [Vibrio sp.]|nr:DUF2799 domain-containing protein [Vibrio sp.]